MALAIRPSCSQRNSARGATSATPRSPHSKRSRVRSETRVKREFPSSSKSPELKLDSCAARRALEANLSAADVVLRCGNAARELRTVTAESQDALLAVDCAYQQVLLH